MENDGKLPIKPLPKEDLKVTEGHKIINLLDNFGRRSGIDRRMRVLAVKEDRRSGRDRRSRRDRRNGVDRRSKDQAENASYRRRSGIDRRDFLML